MNNTWLESINSPFCKGMRVTTYRGDKEIVTYNLWKRHWNLTILKLVRFVCFVLLEKILRQGLQSSVNYKWLTRNSWSNKIKKIQIQTISETLLFGNFITNSKKETKITDYFIGTEKAVGEVLKQKNKSKHCIFFKNKVTSLQILWIPLLNNHSRTSYISGAFNLHFISFDKILLLCVYISNIFNPLELSKTLVSVPMQNAFVLY